MTDPEIMQASKEKIGLIINKELIKQYFENQKEILKRHYKVEGEVNIEASEFNQH